MGVAHHANYPVWFEIGRSEVLQLLGLRYRDIEARGFYLMLSGLQVHYRRAARYDDDLTLETWMQEARSRKLVFAYRLLRELQPGATEVLATGRTEHIMTDRSYRVASVPTDVLALLKTAVDLPARPV
nr:thioesterase family protein [Deinococcus peraridilitoris]